MKKPKKIKYAWTCSTSFDCELGYTAITLSATKKDAFCGAEKPRSSWECYPVRVAVKLAPMKKVKRR